MIKYLRSPDGAIYAFPNASFSNEKGNDTFSAYINTTRLDNLGLEMLTNWDELVTVLRAFKEQDPNGKMDEPPAVGVGASNTTGKPALEKAHEILQTAYDAGVTVLDTAAAYGNSEEVVGSYLKAHDHNMLVISKFNFRNGDPVAVFVRSVFLQGMLCMEKVPERFGFMRPSLDAITEVAKAGGMTLPQMAIACTCDLPGVTSLVLGCETAQQVRENAEMVNVRKLTATELADITEISKKVPIEHCMEVIKQRKSNEDEK